MVYKEGVAFLSRWRWPLLAALLPLSLGAGIRVHRWLVAAGVFLRLEKASEPAWLVHYDERPVREHELPEGRLYSPPTPHGAILLPHGMHPDGIDDPRLIGFARALAGAGFLVLTPRLPQLARFVLDPQEVSLIADGAALLATLSQQPQVTVLGISFGGGMAIRAACEGASAIGRVIALGAHHDAERVGLFYLGEPARGPHGELAAVEPHPYGRKALFMSLFGHNHQGPFSAAQRAQVLAGLEAERARLKAVSPSGCSRLRVPLALVHGSADRVVPYTETLWNAAQFAPQVPVRSLISPAIVHAEYEPPSLRERLSLIAFMVDGLW